MWIDDVTKLGDVVDPIRQAASGETRSHKSLDRHGTQPTEFLPTIALSGDGIAILAEEKASGDGATKFSNGGKRLIPGLIGELRWSHGNVKRRHQRKRLRGFALQPSNDMNVTLYGPSRNYQIFATLT